MKPKSCLFCEQPLQGRTDKKFCDDHCRSAFNNRTNGELNRKMRFVNQVLRRNRKILQAFLGEKNGLKEQVRREKIQELGFVFNFHTHTQRLDDGDTCFCCYEYGYIPIGGNELKLIKVN